MVRSIENNSPIEAEALLNQVADELPQAVSRGLGRVKINLSPPHLGRLDIDILVRESRVQVVLTAGNRDVQQVLQMHVDRLRDALQQQGLHVDGFNVLLNGNQNHHGHDSHAGGGSALWRESNRGNEGRKETEGETSLATTASLVKDGKPEIMRNGISLFV